MDTRVVLNMVKTNIPIGSVSINHSCTAHFTVVAPSLGNTFFNNQTKCVPNLDTHTAKHVT